MLAEKWERKEELRGSRKFFVLIFVELIAPNLGSVIAPALLLSAIEHSRHPNQRIENNTIIRDTRQYICLVL